MLSNDLFDFQLSVLVAITVQLAVTFAALLVEYEHFVTLDEFLYYFANYLCAFHGGSTDGHCAVVVYQQHFLKFNSLAFLCLGQVVDEEALACFGLELLTVNLYDCVHFKMMFKRIFPGGGPAFAGHLTEPRRTLSGRKFTATC